MTKNQRISGTREWSVKSVNCCTGCSHNCRYCYAKYNMVDRFKQVESDDWTDMKIREKDVNKRRQLEKGTVMFPTTHDITPEVLDSCLTVIRNLINVGNHVLLVSKPHIECIKRICTEFNQQREQILFRFTIGAKNDDILKYWEPNAPNYAERKTCLKLAYFAGFATSVSVEPMLDPANILEHVAALEFNVTDSIWVGHMNKSDSRVKIETNEDQEMLDRILNWQTKEKTLEIYEKLKDHPKIKWKESIKQIVGLDLLTEPGLDK